MGLSRKRDYKGSKTCLNPSCEQVVSGSYCSTQCRREHCVSIAAKATSASSAEVSQGDEMQQGPAAPVTTRLEHRARAETLYLSRDTLTDTDSTIQETALGSTVNHDMHDAPGGRECTRLVQPLTESHLATNEVTSRHCARPAATIMGPVSLTEKPTTHKRKRKNQVERLLEDIDSSYAAHHEAHKRHRLPCNETSAGDVLLVRDGSKGETSVKSLQGKRLERVPSLELRNSAVSTADVKTSTPQADSDSECDLDSDCDECAANSFHVRPNSVTTPAKLLTPSLETPSETVSAKPQVKLTDTERRIHDRKPSSLTDLVETNISNLVAGDSLYLLHERNQWFRVKLCELLGNQGRVQYRRSGREVEVVFLENGMAISSDEFAITRWTFTTPGKRNVGVNLVDKEIVLSSTHANTFRSKVYGFDVATGASEVVLGTGKVLMLLVKDNGVAFEFGTTRKYSWSLATGHKLVGAKQVGKWISVERKCNDWISGKVQSFDRESQACKVVYEDGTVEHLLIQANEIARNLENDQVFKWRKKWVESPRGEGYGQSWNKNVPSIITSRRKSKSSQSSPKPAFVQNGENSRREKPKICVPIRASGIETAKDRSFVRDQLVRVEERSWAGVNKEGGVGRICEVNDDGTYSIRFHVGTRRTEKQVAAKYIHEYDMYSQDSAVSDHFVLCESQGEGARESARASSQTPQHKESIVPATTFNFVRRSIRRPGLEQLRRPATQNLLSRLRANDPEDKAMRVLRLKNHLEADTNALVLLEILKLLESNDVVEVLYIHNFNHAMDDLLLDKLARVLKTNSRIWALNVGENFRVTRSGWERFAAALSHTHITHLYAGSESTVNGELKVQMRDAIRENRKKHDRHIDPENLDVILQIGQMWWNPKNARALRPFVDVDLLCNMQRGR